MPKINVLPDYIASQIAAGEVVERPSSVVKELVENALDAGATQVEVSIGPDCRDIRVADDGCGMSADDAVLAFHRHATSKLTSAEDLSSLKTLGFRGEALPSIGSVAHVSCLTRTADSANGTKLIVEEGTIKSSETGCAQGTIIEVCDLFYNVPARLKFLKKGSTEFAHIHEIVQSLAVAHPKVVFQLLNQGEVIFRTSGSGKLADVMAEVGLLKGKEDLIPITGVEMKYGMAVYGYVARPPQCRGDRRGILSIVNNRPVRCHLTYKALDYCFSDLIPRGRNPIGVLTITIDPQQVDINVHPTKKEIKYANSSDVYLALQRSIMEGLRSMPVAEIESQTPVYSYERSPAVAAIADSVIAEAYETPVQEQQQPLGERKEIAIGSRTYQKIQQLGFRERFTYTPPSRIASSPLAENQNQTNKLPARLPLGWRLAGYIFNTYILFETPEGFKIVEQHIAHERLIYERLLAQQENPGRISEMVQHLVISAPLNLSAEQRACLAENLEILRGLGFDFDFQPNFIACTQVPLELSIKDYAGTVQQIIEEILTADNANFPLEATKSLACQAAIKNGMVLSENEIIDLVAEWYTTPRKDTCPHGRPVCLSYSKDKLFQLFHPN
ncbi:MAG: DNA mismatch repair endonuclease MutL [Candidatus Obscuribacterales bacterium]|nr:DNA mismatch repair endonuclease MutL [Candidatus Obscuribacterales bacterium]